jgi:hypothetical protein
VRTVAFSPGTARSIFFETGTGDVLIVGDDCPPVKNGCRPTGRIWLASRDDDVAVEVEQDREYSIFRASLTPAADRLVLGTSVVTATVNEKGKVIGSRMGPLVQMRDARTGDIIWSTITKGAGDPDGVAVSPDGKVVGAVVEQTIYLFDAETGDPLREIVVEE